MTKYHLIIFTLVAVVIVIATAFTTKSCTETDTIYVKDTVIKWVQLLGYEIHDTITKIKKKTVYETIHIPDTADALIVNELLALTDSLIEELNALDVDRIATLDTITEPYKDSIKVNYNIIDKSFALFMRFAPRPVRVEQTTLFTPAEIKWYESPYLWGGTGIVIGVIMGVLLAK